jgi:hypothetical protein
LSFLDDIPMATLVAIAAIVLTIIAYINNDVGFQDALLALGGLLGGAGVLGVARNQAGRGIRK